MNDRNEQGYHGIPSPTPQPVDWNTLVTMAASYAGDNARRDTLLETVASDIKGMRADIKQNNQWHEEMGKVIATHTQKLVDHDEQLQALWTHQNQGAQAWRGVWPAIVAAVVGSVLTAIIVSTVTTSATTGASP